MKLRFFENPFDIEIETLVSELQMKIIEFQYSDIIKNGYQQISYGQFSVIGTTYLCEITFSKIKNT